MTFVRTRQFEKKVSKLPQKIRHILVERLRLFSYDQFHILLNNHSLHGSLHKYRSINITGDYRLVYEQYDEGTVRFIDMDTHSNLYGS